MRKQRVVVTLLLAATCALASARKDFFPGQIIPFQPITAEEYNAILDLSNGSPMISEARLIGSGLTAIKGIATNIKNGAMTALNLTGLEPIYSSLFKPNNKVQGYPLCVIRTNRLGGRTGRSFESDSSGSSDGSFSINFVHPVIDDDNDDNDDDDDDNDDPPYHHYPRPPRPSHPSRRPTRRTTTSAPDTGSDGSAPVVNCVVVLKRPSTNSTGGTTTTTTTTTTPYPHNPHNPHYYHPPYYPPYPSTTSSSTTTTTTTTTKKPKPNDNRYNLPNSQQYPYFPYQFIPIPVPYGSWPSNSGNVRNPSSLNAASVPNWPPGQWPWLGNLPGGLGTLPGGDQEDSKRDSVNWPRIPANWQDLWNARKSEGDDGDKLRHHYFGSAAKTNLYNSQKYDAPEIDDDLDIDADAGDVVDARQAPRKSQVSRLRKNHPRAFPAIKNDE